MHTRSSYRISLFSSPQLSALHALAEPDHDRLHVFGGSPILHQEVNHALRFDHQVAPEKKYTEHDGERQHAQHRDLHHTHHEEFSLVLKQHQGAAAVAGHHAVGVVAGVCRQSPGEGLTPVKQHVLGHVEEGDVHISLRIIDLATKPGVQAKLCVM